MSRQLADYRNTSDKIRHLAAASMPRAEIARALGIRYQHVRNVLVADEARAKVVENKIESVVSEPAGVGEGVSPGLLRNKIGPAGRVVIPAAIREKLGLEEGTELVFTLEGDEIHVASMATHLKRLQQKVRALLPESTNLVDELITDRRRDSGAE